jgi:hypothetical protein
MYTIVPCNKSIIYTRAKSLFIFLTQKNAYLMLEWLTVRIVAQESKQFKANKNGYCCGADFECFSVTSPSLHILSDIICWDGIMQCILLHNGR